MHNFINQYKLVFPLFWSIYLIYPMWALPVGVKGRFLIYVGLLAYFAVTALIMNSWFNNLPIDKPFMPRLKSIKESIGSNLWFFIICCVAVILNVSPVNTPILNFGDEAIHIQGGLWVYDYLGGNLHRLLQILFWAAIVIAILIRVNKSLYESFCNTYKHWLTKTGAKMLIALMLFGYSVVHFYMFKDIAYDLPLLRYPPVSKFIYLVTYLGAGITHVGPRLIQVAFYVLGSLYIYRTISLSYDKDTSLVGATMYLFSPVVFYYAHLAQLTSGVAFFVVLISFHFLRYLRDENNRDLLLTSFFIGVGFLYKEDMLLMFIVCSAYLVLRRVLLREIKVLNEIKIMLISLVPVVPWMVIQRFINWRNYKVYGHHLTSLDTLSIYFQLIQTHISWVLFTVFMISIVFVLFYRRNNLTLFYGAVFIAFYFFYTADYTAVYRQHRFSVIFYPAIAVYMSQLLLAVTQRIKWKHSLKLVFIALTTYMIVLSLNPNWGSNIFADRALYFPNDKAMTWVKQNVMEGEKILILRIMPALFYRDKYEIDGSRIVHFWYEMGDVSTPDKLWNVAKNDNINYIMFPYSPDYPYSRTYATTFKYLKENKGDEFDVAAEYKLGENIIYVYKIKEN